MARSLTLFASHGVDAVSIRDIASAAGFTNPALFRHFPTKEALAIALFEECYRRLVAALRNAARLPGLQAWLTAALAEIAHKPHAVLYVLENVRRYFASLPADLKADNLPALTRAMIEREQRAGRFCMDLDVPMAITVVLGALGQIARAAHFHDIRLDAAERARCLAHLLTGGFQPRPAALR